MEISTLLAIDAYQREPTFQAEDILRYNLSLLPIPVVISPLIPVVGGGPERVASVNGRQISNILYSPDGLSFVTAVRGEESFSGARIINRRLNRGSNRADCPHSEEDDVRAIGDGMVD